MEVLQALTRNVNESGRAVEKEEVQQLQRLVHAKGMVVVLETPANKAWEDAILPMRVRDGCGSSQLLQQREGELVQLVDGHERFLCSSEGKCSASALLL